MYPTLSMIAARSNDRSILYLIYWHREVPRLVQAFGEVPTIFWQGVFFSMMPEKNVEQFLKTYQRDYSGFHMICSKEFLWQIFCEKSIILWKYKSVKMAK